MTVFSFKMVGPRMGLTEAWDKLAEVMESLFPLVEYELPPLVEDLFGEDEEPLPRVVAGLATHGITDLCLAPALRRSADESLG